MLLAFELQQTVRRGGRKIDTDFGLTTTNMLEASLNGAMINAARRKSWCWPTARSGRRGFSKICDLEAVDASITVAACSHLYLERLLQCLFVQ